MTYTEFKDKKIVVVGMARSGIGAARTLQRFGARVTATDSRQQDALPDLSELTAAGVELALGGHPDALLDGTSLIVISPGVPYKLPFLEKARGRGISVISELELACRLSDSPFVAITGTNGKSTTTTLVAEMLKAAGLNIFLGGNIGNALTDNPDDLRGRDFVVAEVSSFQLETIESFRPKVSAILNITPDHLDRYADMAEYAWAKARIFENQRKDDFLVLNADDQPTWRLRERAACKVVPFSRKRYVQRGVFVDSGRLVSNLSGSREVICLVSDIRIIGAHNLENALAAAAISIAAGAKIDAVARVLREFAGLPHRLELVGTIGGVDFINDSKGTNIGAVEKSLEGFTSPVVLIAGGLGKGTDFTPLRPLIQEKVKALVLIGKSAKEMAVAFDGLTPIHYADGMDEAVKTAAGLAEPGETVLLSPACASFDMFKNFEDRGEKFAEAVGKLK
ncbi:MAG: UDP-N-acetylmuramoyl-L-alanine--D-glutamate ligase [Nitrospirota bacterium]|nr:UDP-N-acetylmuramoyl-L-alanine--D-glutamate ligase [Nitrospirota bacterium]